MPSPMPLATQRLMAEQLMRQGWICTEPKRYNARNAPDGNPAVQQVLDNQRLLVVMREELRKQTRTLRGLLQSGGTDALIIKDSPNNLSAAEQKDADRIKRIAESGVIRSERVHTLDVKPGQRRHDILLTIAERGPSSLNDLKPLLNTAGLSSRLAELVKGELLSRDEEGVYRLTEYGTNKLEIINSKGSN